MFRLVVVALFFVAVSKLQADVTPAMIDADATELAQFSRKLRAVYPQAVRGLIKTSCQVIAECCPSVGSDVLSIALSGDREELAEKCFGKKEMPTYREKVAACGPVVKAKQMAQHPEAMKFLSIDKSKLAYGKVLGQAISAVCSADDVMSIVCDSDKDNKLLHCQRKMLKNLADNSTEEVYKKKVNYIKTKAMEYGEVIKQAFS